MLRKVAILPLLALLLSPAVGHALGLGEVRVLSSLNEPLAAEIALTDLRSGELDALQVRLASVEQFSRVGLDRAFLLTQLQFSAEHNAAGEPVISVTTREAVREPFLSFLIEANWSRGRLLREYTILLDPPVLMPAVASTVRPAWTEPVQPPARVEATEPTRRTPPSLEGRIPEDRMRAGPGSYGAIQRNETLWSIAERVKPSADITTSQMMLALFEANPDAFYGNINRMKTGYILRVPERDAITQRSAAAAVQEVSRQNDAWRTGEAIDFQISEAGPSGRDDQLRLTAPDSGADGDDPAGSADGADGGLQGRLAAAEDAVAEERAARESLTDRLVELESEADRLRRELEIRDAELAALTGVVPDRVETPVTEPDGMDEPGTDEPVADEPAEEPAEEPKPQPPPVVEEPTLLDHLTNPLILALLLGVPIVLAIVFVALRRRRASTEANRMLAPEADEDDATQFGAMADAVDAEGEQTVIREEEVDAAAAAASKPEPAAPAVEDDMDTSAVMSLDDGDPASEADFHLAYGLYDQAADLMEGAYKQHPERVDYLMKLLEIYFAWGKPDEFIAHAREGKTKLEAAGEWANVAILGRQMKGDEPLFSEMMSSGTRSGAIDLDLEGDDGGEAEMDLDTGTFEGDFDLGEPEADAGADATPAEAPAGNEVEFDLGDFEYETGAAESEPEPESEPAPAPAPEEAPADDDNAIDFGLDDEGEDATQFKVAPTEDDGALDMDIDSALEGLESDGDSADVESAFSDEATADTKFESPSADSAEGADDGMDLDFDALLADDGGPEPEPDADAEGGSGDSRLDLARAYIDMGDADGARGLLNEVLADGDDAQKQEAQELLKLI
ncbi:MAG: FimV/HubP family polar landmark protein [Gammaproteobacteria bacterium]